MTAQREVSVLIVKPFAMPSNSAHDGCTERGTDKGNLSHAFMRAKSIIAYPIPHKHPEAADAYRKEMSGICSTCVSKDTLDV